MIIAAKGILQHHFWGTYSATVLLKFSDQHDAEKAERILNRVKLTRVGRDACGRAVAPGAWRIIGSDANVLGIFASDKDVDIVVEQLCSFGADKRKITSIKYSIDHGEKFEINMSVPDSNQLELHL